MSEFEKLLQENIVPLKRYVNFKIDNKHDAEDIIQDICLVATLKFDSLRNKSAFKGWLIGIANNKCNDYYRQRAKNMDISLDSVSESLLSVSRFGVTEQIVVRDTLRALGDKEKQILHLYFFEDLSQEDISKRLSVPLGTVKSRLHYAKEKFKQHYPYKETEKGDIIMKRLPEYLPNYKIEKSKLAPFDVKCEELMGFCIVPKLNERITWGSYDIPSRKMNDFTEASVVGKAEVHGIEGVEIIAKQHICASKKEYERYFVAQLTDTHCRYLAESHFENGVRKTFTFLDSDIFMNNWGFGEDNCGYETYITQKNAIARTGNSIEVKEKKELVDIVGRYTVTIGDKAYDTVCVMDIGHFDSRIAIEQYIDKNGRTILWRRFNKNDWASKRYGKQWTEMLPDNERLIINGETYVHWYDCVTDYIF
ncbi:MAG: RNA polymerase sigma factor [Clostridia bacterium]|nr:RNA polymerase sigma factor [Clostridia bacterium]